MCRNIKTLRRYEAPPSEAELRLAALQFVRKVSGYRSPSRLNQEAFDQAVEEIAEATRKLLENLVTRPPAARQVEPGEAAPYSGDHRHPIEIQA